MIFDSILLIHASHHDNNQQVVRSASIMDRLTIGNVSQLSLLLIAGATPTKYKVTMVEDCFEEIDYQHPALVVGISCQVMQFSRVKEMALKFKQNGKIVILGGFLPTMHPNECLEFADAVCIGEGETSWQNILIDIENDRLKPKYTLYDNKVEIEKLPVPRYDLIKRNRFISYPLQATRGCPFKCNYCSIIEFYENKYKKRPVEEIIKDLKEIPSKYLHFVDDNLMEDKTFAIKLFESMKKFKKLWGTQSTINVAKSPELLKSAYASGCRFIAIGFESLNQKNLNNMSKNFNQVDEFHQAIENIHQSGIAVHALIMFGLESDTIESYQATIDYLIENGIAIADFFTLTPYPATPLGKQMREQNKITDDDLSHLREGYICYKHPTLTNDQLLEAYWKGIKNFYSLKNIFKRIWKGKYKNKFYHLMFNLGYYIKIKRGIIPVYFGNNQVKSFRSN